MGVILAITGDHHANSTVGLCPSSFKLDDGGLHVASERQRWIWGRWLAFWRSVQNVKEHTGWPVTSIILGEIVDDLNHKHKTTQVITNNKADIIRLGETTLAPVLETADNIVVLRGTEAHSGPSACLDEILAENIGAERSPQGTYSWWQYRAVYDGVVIDAAHHPGTRTLTPHTAGNEANRLASKIFYEYGKENIIRSRSGQEMVPWPHLVLRGHNHRPADSGDNQPGGHPLTAVRAIITPSWQVGTAFGYRLGGDTLPIGGLIITCKDARFKVHKIYYWPSSGLFPSADSWSAAATIQ